MQVRDEIGAPDEGRVGRVGRRLDGRRGARTGVGAAFADRGDQAIAATVHGADHRRPRPRVADGAAEGRNAFRQDRLADVHAGPDRV